MSDLTTEVIVVHLEYLRRAADETNAHLAKLNGRVGTAETEIAVLKATDPSKSGAKSGAVVSAAVAALIAAVSALIKALGVGQ